MVEEPRAGRALDAAADRGRPPAGAVRDVAAGARLGGAAHRVGVHRLPRGGRLDCVLPAHLGGGVPARGRAAQVRAALSARRHDGGVHHAAQRVAGGTAGGVAGGGGAGGGGGQAGGGGRGGGGGNAGRRVPPPPPPGTVSIGWGPPPG